MGQKKKKKPKAGGCGQMNDFWAVISRQWAELLPAGPAQPRSKPHWNHLSLLQQLHWDLGSGLLNLHSTFQENDRVSGKHTTFFVTRSNDSYMHLTDITPCEFSKETAHGLRDGINVMKCLGALPSCWLKQTREAAFHSSSHQKKHQLWLHCQPQ